MSNAIIQLKDKDGNLLYPITKSAAIKDLPSSGNTTNVIDLGNDQVPVLLKDLQQGYVTTGSDTDSVFNASENAVTMRCPFQIPYAGVIFNIICPGDIKVRVLYGNSDLASWTTTRASQYVSNYLYNGDFFKFPIENDVAGNSSGDIMDHHIWFYRIEFTKTDNTNISVDSINDSINNTKILITYNDPTGGVIKRNPKALEAVNSASYNFINDNDKLYKRFNENYVHITDLHGNAYILANAIKIAKYINARAIFLTGDVVTQSSVDGYTYVADMCKDCNIPVFITTGNHDGVGQDLDIFNKAYIDPIAKLYGYNYTSGLGYYYKDLTDSKIRIIAMDNSDSTNHYRINSVGEVQLSWFKGVLDATPSGYGVIILNHQNYGVPKTDSASQYPQFMDIAGRDTGDNGEVDTDATIKSYIDNFIDNNGEFIMDCAGHNHMDMFGQTFGTKNIQLMSDVTCGSMTIDMINGYSCRNRGYGNGADAIDTYTIDRTLHTVTLTRFGCNTLSNGKTRLTQTIPYK